VKSPIVRELRAVERFTISLPVHLNWPAAGRSVQGFTRDISTRGMFVTADFGPAQGELLEFEIDLALDEFTPLMLVGGEGRVVRVEGPSPAAQSFGFAVHNLWFKLREPEEGEVLARDMQASAGGVAGLMASVRKRDRRRQLSIVPPKGEKDPD
jgi:hypothetical protein